MFVLERYWRGWAFAWKVYEKKLFILTANIWISVCMFYLTEIGQRLKRSFDTLSTGVHPQIANFFLLINIDRS